MKLEEIIKNGTLLEIGRKAIEDELIYMRDARLSQPFENNGLVIREKTGELSSTIRITTARALHIGLEAIAKHLKD